METIEEIAANNKAVLRGPDGVNPARGDEHCVSGEQIDSIAFFCDVAQPSVVLARVIIPGFIRLEVLLLGWYKEKGLPPA